MKDTIHLQLAKLRKTKGLTQQELAEIVGTSFQTISKWENGVTMPDVTVLPVLASFFKVSVDELLGLVTLKGDMYISEDTDKEVFWNKKLEYLQRTRRSAWNTDYLDFLIHKVWNINQPVDVLDCGCGYGYMGILLMPLLPEGSTYVGIDFSEKLIEEGKRIFAANNIEGELIQSDILQFHPIKRYNMVLCQSVLRHVGNSRAIIKQMINLTTTKGLVICIDSNRELECAGLYIEGMEYTKLCNHVGAEKHWNTELANGDRDYAAAMRNAYVMRELVLKHIGLRMNDHVSFVCPEEEDYENSIQDFLQQNRSWYEDDRKVIERLISHGMTREEADNYYRKGKVIEDYFIQHTGEVSYIQFKGKTIAYGWKE